MPDGTLSIRCPHCGHPYTMSRMQVEVYAGRQMGCMACGRPFPVTDPTPPPAEEPPAGGAAAVGDVAARDEGVVATAGIEHADPVATSTSSTTSPASTRNTPAVGPTGPALGDRLGVAAGLAFFFVCAVAAVMGVSSAPPEGAHAAPTFGPAVLVAAIGGPACAVAAFSLGAFGWWRVTRARRDHDASAAARYRPVGFAVAAVGLGATELALAGLLAILTWPPVARGLDDNRRAICQTQLQQIGHALVAAASARPDGQFPDEMAGLPGVTADVLVCPADHGHGTGHVSYRYVGKDLSTRPGSQKFADPFTVLAYEPPGLHPGGFHVLFADRAVVFVEKTDAEAMARELEAGQNPPPTAQAVRGR